MRLGARTTPRRCPAAFLLPASGSCAGESMAARWAPRGSGSSCSGSSRTSVPFVEDEPVRGTIMRAAFGRGLSFWTEAVRLQALRLTTCMEASASLQLEPFSVEAQGKWNSWHVTVLADAHYLLR